MNPNIASLYAIANKPVRKIIGLMSGTSFDGLDIALCEFSGCGLETKVKVINFVSKGYLPAFKEDLKSVFAKRTVDLEKVTLLNAFRRVKFKGVTATASFINNHSFMDIPASGILISFKLRIIGGELILDSFTL